MSKENVLEIEKTDDVSREKKCISEWNRLLQVFHATIEGSPELAKVKDKLTALAEEAELSAILTPRQREGIYARCKNYLSGNYGKDAVKDSYLKTNKG